MELGTLTIESDDTINENRKYYSIKELEIILTRETEFSKGESEGHVQQ